MTRAGETVRVRPGSPLSLGAFWITSRGERGGAGSPEQRGGAGTGDLIQPGFTPVINSVMW